MSLVHDRIEEFKYVFRHKVQFFKTRNGNKLFKDEISFRRALMHDLGKMFNILIFGDRIATKIHRSLAGHHKREKMNFKQKVEAFCDWECARFTKPDKPLNGKETWLKYFPNVDMGFVVKLFEKYEREKRKWEKKKNIMN